MRQLLDYQHFHFLQLCSPSRGDSSHHSSHDSSHHRVMTLLKGQFFGPFGGSQRHDNSSRQYLFRALISLSHEDRASKRTPICILFSGRDWAQPNRLLMALQTMIGQNLWRIMTNPQYMSTSMTAITLQMSEDPK